MSLDLRSLLEPIAGGNPIGADLRNGGGLNSIYFKLKDARAQARTTERATEAAGEPPSIPQEWHVVRSLAVEALQNQSKDLEVAAWLLESLLRLEAFSGMTAGFALLQGLVERYWPDVHSIDEDDAAGRISPLAGLNGIGGEGALVQPIRMIALLPECSYGTNALWHLMRVQKEPDSALARDFNDARASAGMAAVRERAVQAHAAREMFAGLNATLDTLCGADAPPSSNIRNALDEVVDAYRSLVGGGIDIPIQTLEATVPVTQAVASPAAARFETDSVVPPSQAPLVSRDLTNREEAFTELLRVADFFRRNEPHSPISYALETLVWRGRMSFVDLLEELIPDATNRKQMLQLAGIHANAEGKTR